MKSFLVLLAVLSIQTAFSQDYIIKKNGDEIKAKVVEVGTIEIKYKKFEKPTGPNYVVERADVFMIKYEDGTKDVLNPVIDNNKAEPVKVESKKDESKRAPESDMNKSVPQKDQSKNSYIDKVREVQAKDPTVRVYLGNGWLLGPGITNPMFGVDVRFPRKNVFLRGISVGLRANFKNLDAKDGDDDERTDYSTAIFGGGVTVNYYAPLPIKMIQPYVVATVGVAMTQTYATYMIPSSSTSPGYLSNPSPSEVIAPYGGFGVGCNFMIARRFGFFVEVGYFRTAAINTGFAFKLF
ncbi:MAG: hypothetical protein M3R27_08355 [Bacteroidota bacterium]|nr:hypothetical protein [Bacteroidota bacterium]